MAICVFVCVSLCARACVSMCSCLKNSYKTVFQIVWRYECARTGRGDVVLIGESAVVDRSESLSQKTIQKSKWPVMEKCL